MILDVHTRASSLVTYIGRSGVVLGAINNALPPPCGYSISPIVRLRFGFTSGCGFHCQNLFESFHSFTGFGADMEAGSSTANYPPVDNRQKRGPKAPRHHCQHCGRSFGRAEHLHRHSWARKSRCESSDIFRALADAWLNC